VVLPLLNFSPQDPVQNVLDKIKKVLGQADYEDAGGPTDNFWSAKYYWLDDKTQITVGFRKDKISFSICVPGRPEKDLVYAVNKP
jgi:hypothetical protein